MSNDIATAAEFHLFGWLDKNKKQLVWAGGGILIMVFAVSFYFWNKGRLEIKAAETLSSIQTTPNSDAAAYISLAAQYPRTSAAAQAVLLAAGNLFSAGKYAEAQAQFDRLLREYSDSPYRVQAFLGTAACMDAQGKTAEAVTRYAELIQRFPTDPATLQAKSALARIYEAQNQFDRALPLYEELAQAANYNSIGLESAVRLQALIARHPELVKPKAPTADFKQP